MYNPPLSPLDGRYRSVTAPLAHYLSEDALNQARLEVEVEWFIFALENQIFGETVAPLAAEQKQYLRLLPEQYGAETEEGQRRRNRLAELESETRHDVKAVEYLVREHLQASGDARLASLVELVHYLATSEDINNLSYALTVSRAMEDVWIPAAEAMINQIASQAKQAAQTPMLSRTHGQSATPTTVGKELGVFVYRLTQTLKRVKQAEYLGKFNGATGTYSAHTVVLPEVDWLDVSRRFVEFLGLTWNPVTTQIESHDWQVRLFADVSHFNSITHNLATDMWQYISRDYFRQLLTAQGSTGSSTMPHKVNPIRFENAEANLELSSALLRSLAETLATSRMQRDLSDSSAQRNIGSALGYSLIALDNVKKGMEGVEVATQIIEDDLSQRWEILGEAIQQALRTSAVLKGSADGQTEAYTVLKEVTRGRQVSAEDLQQVIEAGDLPQDLANRLLALTPATYVGIAEQVAQIATKES